MKKSLLKIACITSGILFTVLGIYFIILVMKICNATGSSAHVGIIGGAGAPTAVFLLQKLASTPVFYAVVLSFLMFIGTGLTLIFRKNQKK